MCGSQPGALLVPGTQETKCQAFAVSLGPWDKPHESHSLAGSQRKDSAPEKVSR